MENVAKSIGHLGASIVALNAAFTAGALLSVTALAGQIMTMKFLNDLVEMQTGLQNVAKSLEKIAESLLKIQSIQSVPELKPISDEGIQRAKSVSSTTISENQNDITSLTESIKDLVRYLKSGNAISTVNLDNRKVSREMAASPVTRLYST